MSQTDRNPSKQGRGNKFWIATVAVQTFILPTKHHSIHNEHAQRVLALLRAQTLPVTFVSTAEMNYSGDEE